MDVEVARAAERKTLRDMRSNVSIEHRDGIALGQIADELLNIRHVLQDIAVSAHAIATKR